MLPLIEQKLSDGRNIFDIVFEPLDNDRKILNFVDVGARNGNYMLPRSYAARCRLTGFEPNRAEYEKLVNGNTDARAAGLIEPPFKDRKYFPDALWSSDGEQILYITKGAGAVTLMGPADLRMTGNMWRENDREQSYLDRVQRVVNTEKVQCATLDTIWKKQDDTIDILKIDAEGGELDILKGAKCLLADQKVLFIFAEFLLLPYYERRVTLGHQQVFLDDLGYRLISIDLNHSKYNWRKTGIQSRKDRWMDYAGDAMYIVDPDRNSLSIDAMYRLGLACMVVGFNAFGVSLIRETGLVAAKDLDLIETQANYVPILRRIHSAWMKFPPFVDRLLSALRMRG
jgi:FkbM family methyltransferase